MFDKNNLIVKQLLEEIWRMEIPLWPLFEAELYLYSKVTSTKTLSSLWAEGSFLCLHKVNVSAGWRRKKSEATDG